MATDRFKAVLDTNVIVSAALNTRGIPASVLAAGTSVAFLISYSPEIFEEYRDVLTRGKFAFSATLVKNLLADIERSGENTKPVAKLRVSPDSSDNKFLECAEAARADYLVTGNTKHFPVRHRMTRVITPREFITVLISTGSL